MKKIAKFMMLSLLTITSFSLGACENQATKEKENVERSTIQPAALIRETNFGQVKGIEDEKVLIWSGIPYGGDTSGGNRWKAPTDPQKWDGLLDTKESGVVALQNSADGAIGNEDALNLDIYRPNNGKENLPVLVYVHGGNNQTGHAQEISGKSFVSNHDAIVVSVNYRLGVLGFNPLPSLKVNSDEENSGNYGLLDIAKSLDWVKENIANFGGDGENITISGFSAGGRDVMAMLISPLFKNKFQQAISFSGGMTIADEEKSQEVFAMALAPLVVEDGVKEDETQAKSWLLTEDSEVREYLLGIEASRLASLMGNASIRMEVFPHLYNDGAVLPKNGFATTQYNDVPLLMITGEQEFSLFGLFDPYFAKYVADDSINTDEGINKQFQFVNTYGGQFYSLFNVNDSAEQLINNYQEPIYNMEIAFGANEKNIDKVMKNFGSFHGVFVPLLDSNNKNYEQFVGTSYESEGAKKMQAAFQDYLYSFIKTGNPNQEELPEWTPWTLNGARENLYLDADKTSFSAVMQEKGYSYEEILNNIEEDQSIPEEQKEYLVKNVLNGRWFSYGLDEKYNNLTEFYK
ncbi:MAG: carboxylesterase family protein [Enterococcus lemanii]|jgi:para-nitrobenzyl esterase